MRYKKVGVLMGGLSAERDVSLASGAAVADGLDSAGYQVVRIDVNDRLDEQLRAHQPDAVFIALHGRLGEDGTVQGLLEMMRLPYTGSSVLASALAMDKVLTRDILSAAGLPVAKGALVTDLSPKEPPPGLSFPLVVKPATEGSSVGISISRTAETYADALKSALDCSHRVLVEQFVAGTEINVAVMDGELLGAVEIEPHREFYDYSAKYDAGGSTHHIPPRLDIKKLSHANELALNAYRIAGCSGAARIDLIVPADGEAIILEINTIPGMTNTSLLPEIAAHAGIPFDELVARIMESATLHV